MMAIPGSVLMGACTTVGSTSNGDVYRLVVSHKRKIPDANKAIASILRS